MLNREHEKISDREVKNRGYQMRPIIFKATHTHTQAKKTQQNVNRDSECRDYQ